jgi:hypothetical protein
MLSSVNYLRIYLQHGYGGVVGKVRVEVRVWIKYKSIVLWEHIDLTLKRRLRDGKDQFGAWSMHDPVSHSPGAQTQLHICQHAKGFVKGTNLLEQTAFCRKAVSGYC